jgi:PAS domain S-box-containing protein
VDITERKRAESLAAEKDRRYKDLIESVDVAVYTTDADGYISMYNQKAVELWGRVPEVGRDRWWGALKMRGQDGNELPPEESTMAIALREGRSVSGQQVMIERPDGSTIWVEPHPSALHDAFGAVVGGADVFVDVSNRVRADAALRQSEDEFRDFFENAAIGLHLVGPDGTILRANAAELDMLGYAEHEYVGHNIAEFYEDEAVIKDVMRRLSRRETLHDYEARLKCKDGSSRIVLVDSSVLWRDGKFVHTRCFTRDISQLHKAVETQERLGAIVASSDDCIISKDLDGTIRSWNAGAQRMLGYMSDEIIGRSIRTVVPEDRQSEEDEVLARIGRGEKVDHFDTVRQRKDGTFVDISLSVSPIKDRLGRIIGASTVARDITDRKVAERALQESIALKDQFLGLISHELRTPLSTIYGGSRLLLDRFDLIPLESRHELLRDIAEESLRLQRIIENLLLMTKLDASGIELEPVSLERRAKETLEHFQQQHAEREFTFNAVGDRFTCPGNDTYIDLVVTNLLMNAVKYSDPSFVIDVAVQDSGPEVEIRVMDRGIGFSDSDAEKLFVPFFRSNEAKAKASGVGVGLAVCKRVIEAQGGEIWAHARGGGGAEFGFSLPKVSLRDTAP